MRRTIFLLAAALGSCGGGSSGGSDANGGSETSGDFTVEIKSSELRSVIGKTMPRTGRTFAVLEVTISNQGEVDAILANGALFSVLTDGAISVPISGALAALPSPCLDLSVAKGGKLSCGLAFEVPVDDPPAKLVYDDKLGHSATTTIPEPTKVCPAAGWGSSSCKTCIGSAVLRCGFPPPGCSTEEENCFLSKVQTSASALCTAPTACTQSSACMTGLGSEADCFVAQCASKCNQ